MTTRGRHDEILTIYLEQNTDLSREQVETIRKHCVDPMFDMAFNFGKQIADEEAEQLIESDKQARALALAVNRYIDFTGDDIADELTQAHKEWKEAYIAGPR